MTIDHNDYSSDAQIRLALNVVEHYYSPSLFTRTSFVHRIVFLEQIRAMTQRCSCAHRVNVGSLKADSNSWNRFHGAKIHQLLHISNSCPWKWNQMSPKMLRCEDVKVWRCSLTLHNILHKTNTTEDLEHLNILTP